MALVVEDGSGVVGANSYLSVAELRAYATERGIVLPADPGVEPLLIKAADYLELRTYIGTKVNDDQGLSWPRNTVDGWGVTVELAVPVAIKRAQSLLAVEAMNGALSSAARPSKYTKTKIDVVQVEYRKTSEMAVGMRYLAVDTLLEPYVTASSGRPFQTFRA